MKNFLSKHLGLIIAVILGGILGYLYWFQIGCSSGSCSITSKWYNSTLYGALMAGLLVNIFQKEEVKQKK